MELLKVVGGGHTWPGTTGTVGGGPAREVLNKDINASLEVWKFVSRYTISTPKSLTETTTAADIESGSLSIFPNPTSSDVTISVTGNSTINSVQLVDLAGSVVSQSLGLNTPQFNINCSGTAAGTYFAVIKLNNGATLTKKVIIL